MTVLQALFLGAIQGLTEFLPVSSSGHLVLFEHVLHLDLPQKDLQGFDVMLHAATAFALLGCYWSQWKQILSSPFTGDRSQQRLFLLLILATIPGAFAGLFLEDIIAEHLRSVHAVGVALIITAILLLLTILRRGEAQIKGVSIMQVLVMGFGQACAIIPGISRSGTTISVGQLSGIARRDALDFSFLMALPIIAGASASTVMHLLRGSMALPSIPVIAAGFCTSLIMSIMAIIWLRKFVAKRSLSWFAIYLLPVGFLLLSGSGT